MLMSYLLPRVKQEWNLSRTEEADIMTFTFFGMLVGEFIIRIRCCDPSILTNARRLLLGNLFGQLRAAPRLPRHLPLHLLLRRVLRLLQGSADSDRDALLRRRWPR